MTLEPPSFDERLAIDAYTSAKTSALTTADSLATNIVTVAFSLLSAYGALVALVHAKSGTSLFAIASPFIGLAIVVALGLLAQSRTVADVGSPPRISEIENAIKDATDTKHTLLYLAMALMAITLAGMGVVIGTNYRSSNASQPDKADAGIVGHSKDRLTSICGRTVTTVTVDVQTLDSSFVIASAPNCPNGPQTVLIPSADITAAIAR